MYFGQKMIQKKKNLYMNLNNKQCKIQIDRLEMIMMERMTRRFIINNLDGINISFPIRYERYYVDDYLRIQKKAEKYQKEILDKNNCIISKTEISEEEFNRIKERSIKRIIRDSYLYNEDSRISIKKYYEDFEGLIRVEVTFKSKEEMKSYKKESWMGKEITNSNLAFDKFLIKLNRNEFLEELNKYINQEKLLWGKWNQK